MILMTDAVNANSVPHESTGTICAVALRRSQAFRSKEPWLHLEVGKENEVTEDGPGTARTMYKDHLLTDQET